MLVIEIRLYLTFRHEFRFGKQIYMIRHIVDFRMVFQTNRDGVTMTTMRIDNETKEMMELVRSHVRAMNSAAFTSDNSITKKTLKLYIRQYELEYLLDKKDITQHEIDVLDDVIIKRDPSWKESRNRIDSHINQDVRESTKEFGNYLFKKGEFDQKPGYNEILSFLLNFYSKYDKDFINPNLKTKYIVRMEKARKMRNEQQVYNV